MHWLLWICGAALLLYAAPKIIRWLTRNHKPTQAEKDFDDLSGGGEV